MKHYMKRLLVWMLVLAMVPLPVSAADTVPEEKAAGNEAGADISGQIDGDSEEKEEIPASAEENTDKSNEGESEESQSQETDVDSSKETESPEGDEEEEASRLQEVGNQSSEAAPQGDEEEDLLYDLEALDKDGKLTVETETKAGGWTCTGSPICPKVLKISMKTDAGVEVIPSDWYEVSYADNVSCGASAKIIIKGKNAKVLTEEAEPQTGEGSDGQSEEEAKGCKGTISRTFSIRLAKPVLSSSSTYTAITVSWASVSGAALYHIYKSDSANSGFALIGTTSGLGWSDANTKFNASYYYKVEAQPIAGSAFGSISDVIQVTKKVAPATIKSAQLSTMTSVKVKWKKVDGAQGYAVYYSTDKNGTYKKAKTINGKNKTSCTVKKLKKGTRYYFKVCAYRKSGKTKCFSDFGVAKIMTIPKSKRMKFMFPKGTPKKKSAMEKYLVTITVPIKDADGNSSTLNLRVHKALADDFQDAFQEMYNIGFPVRAEDTDTYNWRSMASGKSRSHHSYGCVVDINWDSNPMKGVTDGVYRPGVDPYSVTSNVVAIWKKYGFYWGGNWKSSKDYMHFSYTNH